MNAIAMNGGVVDGGSSGRFLFSSRIPADQRAALEHLLFFNEHQSRVRGALREVIERWGCPEIVEDAGFLSVTLAGHAGVQCLFATQARAGGLRPVGLVIYLRDGAEHLTVLHVGLSPAFASGGLHAEANLLGRLMHEVKRVARRTGGIRKLLVAYRALRGPAAARTGVALAS